MKNKMDMTPICDKCGATAPIDNAKTNDNWQVYDTSERCKCGGNFVPRFILECKGNE